MTASAFAWVLKREGRLRPELACEITRQIAGGLRQIHENGLVHGAIRPSNVLLTEEGTFKILELGISEITANSIDSSEEELRYLAPESLETHQGAVDSDAGEPTQAAADARSDIFSLGCILYELIFGTPAFASEDRKSLPQGLMRGGQDVQLSAMLSATLSGMLAPDPKKRVQTAKDVIHAMRNWADADKIEEMVVSHIHQSDIWEVSDAIVASSGPDATYEAFTGGSQSNSGSPSGADDWDENVDWALLEETDWNSGESGDLVPEPHRNLTPSSVAMVSAVFAVACLLSLALVGFRTSQARPTATALDQPAAVTQPTIEADNVVAAAPESTAIDSVQTANEEPLRGSYHARLAKHLKTKYQLPSPRWVLSNNESTCLNDAVHYGHMVTQSSVHGMNFTRAVQMIVEDGGGAAWDAGYFVPAIDGLQSGDLLLLVVWLRTESVHGQQGKTGTLRLFCEEEDTDDKDFYIPVRPTSEWQRYLIPFRSRSDGSRRVGFHLAYTRQTIEFGGLALLNFGRSIPFAHLPHELHSDEPFELNLHQ